MGVQASNKSVRTGGGPYGGTGMLQACTNERSRAIICTNCTFFTNCSNLMIGGAVQSGWRGQIIKQITTAEARKHLAELLNRAAYAKERFVVTRHGKELVAIVPLEEVTLLDRLRSLLSKKDFEAEIQEMEDSGTWSWDEVRRELDL